MASALGTNQCNQQGHHADSVMNLSTMSEGSRGTILWVFGVTLTLLGDEMGRGCDKRDSSQVGQWGPRECDARSQRTFGAIISGEARVNKGRRGRS
jgi:hypothetical protein